MLNDLITAVLVAFAAVIASGLLDRIWCPLEDPERQGGKTRPRTPLSHHGACHCSRSFAGGKGGSLPGPLF
jgi:hypothetical protein